MPYFHSSHPRVPSQTEQKNDETNMRYKDIHVNPRDLSGSEAVSASERFAFHIKCHRCVAIVIGNAIAEKGVLFIAVHIALQVQ